MKGTKMKTIGLIGGMSWESTVTYYQVINESVKNMLGGFHSSKIMMYNVDFAELEENMRSGNWDGNAVILSEAAKKAGKGRRARCNFGLLRNRNVDCAKGQRSSCLRHNDYSCVRSGKNAMRIE